LETEQFGLPTVVTGLGFAYAGSALYAWRVFTDRRRAGLPGIAFGLQLKLTAAMLLVLALDGSGYLLAVRNLSGQHPALMTALSDIFVAVAILSISVALVLPGMIGHSAREVSAAARRLATGTLAEFSTAMQALGRGDLDAAHVTVDIAPVRVYTHDEVGEMAASFNLLQAEIRHAATGLDGAREGLRQARNDLTEANLSLERRVHELHLAEEKLSGVLDSIDNVVWSVDAHSHHMIYANSAIEGIYGRPMAEFDRAPLLWLEAIHADDRTFVVERLGLAAAQGGSPIQYRIVRPDGEIRWLEARIRRVEDRDGRPLRLDGVASDISERKLHEVEMAHLANHDALTGLPNRNLLNERIVQALSRARREGRSVGVLFLDLDGFKYVNDSFGHTLGDTLLKTVAARLRHAVRESDTVARLGGDEFVLVLDSGHAEEAEVVAAKLVGIFSRPLPADGRSLHLTASIGISVYPQDGDSAEMLLKHADVAMYRAKERGRNSYQRYARAMSLETEERVRLENALRDAVEHQRFELHYQPQADLADGRVSGVEALIRWDHPESGMISPSRFIPLAEDTGLIMQIGAWTLDTACAQLARWRAAGHVDLTMAVNLSARQFHLHNVPQLVRQTLHKHRVPAQALELELTESALMLNAEGVVETLRELKAIGVSLAMDDFGTGYSSLSHLKRFPIDTIKIDQSFIVDLPDSEDAALIVRAILAMARSLGLKTVGEGVESAEQLDFLGDNGCDTIQGHYFSRGCNAAAISRLLAEK
ncbi:MAG: EAL domain-containing protein, partial [Nevskia sp.]|nr:EAL domain-containing protein [Nevskia sp.]